MKKNFTNEIIKDLLEKDYIIITKCDSEQMIKTKDYLLENGFFKNSYNSQGKKCYEITPIGLEARRNGFIKTKKKIDSVRNKLFVQNLNIKGDKNNVNITNNSKQNPTDKINLWANFLSILSSISSVLGIKN